MQAKPNYKVIHKNAMLMTNNMEYVIICSRIQRPFPIGMSFIKDEGQ